MLSEVRSEKFFKFSIVWGTISSCLILIFVKIGITNQMIFSLKDLVIYSYAFLLYKVWLNKKTFGALAFVLFFIVILICNYLLLNEEYLAPANNIRQIIAPLIVLLIYTGVNLTKESFEKVLKFFCCIAIFIFLFGIFEQAFQLWEKMSLIDYFRAKNISVNESGLPYMFYEPMFGYRERMTSVLIDPISLGHFFATFGSYLFYIKDKDRIQKITYCLCITGLCLCLSKGAILQFFICVFFFNKKIPVLIRLLFLFLPFIILQIILDNINIAGILLHIGGLGNAIESISLFGHGIGAAGNYSAMFSDTTTKFEIGDTYVGALLGQIGIIGTLIWILLGFVIINYAIGYKESKLISLKLFFSIFLVSILSENTMNVTSFLLPSIIIGLCINTDKDNIKS